MAEKGQEEANSNPSRASKIPEEFRKVYGNIGIGDLEIQLKTAEKWETGQSRVECTVTLVTLITFKKIFRKP